HLHGVKVYVAFNTLINDGEMADALALAGELCRVGVDALIVADLGLVRRLRRELPEMELHASTQMSIYNREGADLAYSLGCTRVVLAREVSGENIARVTADCLPETEVFLHGALCVCHSGQCLFSSLVGGRSGNRGECAQPCRLPYSGGYPLSLTDLSLAEHIPSLIKSGVASLKIEGRMKSPDYVYTVTSIYRRLLDECRQPTKKEVEMLLRAFSRGGFTDGYYTGKIESKSMLGVRSRDDKAASREGKESLEISAITPTRVKISASVTVKEGCPAALTLNLVTADGRRLTATAVGDTPDAARNQPLTPDGVSARLCKMGGTFFELDARDVAVDLDGGLNLSPAALNALRRNAVAELEARLISREKCGTGAPVAESTVFDTDTENAEKTAASGVNEKPTLRRLDGIRRTAIFYDTDALAGAVGVDFFDLVFIPLDKYAASVVKAEGVALPPVVMQDERDEVVTMCHAAKNDGAKYALVGNLGHISIAAECGLIPVADFRFNVTNLDTGMVVSALGVNNCLLSPELTPAPVRKIGGSAVVYGRIPLMLTERCFMRDTFGCKSCSDCSLTDRKGTKFPMIREYRHRNLILNSAVTYMGDKRDELRGIAGEHFIFTKETAGEISTVINAYKKALAFPLSCQMRRMGRRDNTKG
ncbi:MAG: U32 family peptidase, partial [Clostridia bacterium]|nr:U32 family peptidase [Clostridia bacterium]